MFKLLSYFYLASTLLLLALCQLNYHTAYDKIFEEGANRERIVPYIALLKQSVDAARAPDGSIHRPGPVLTPEQKTSVDATLNDGRVAARGSVEGLKEVAMYAILLDRPELRASIEHSLCAAEKAQNGMLKVIQRQTGNQGYLRRTLPCPS
ncbi:MAG: hypothetical protein Q7S87_01075 [Agitococcus sp.]|nr:hypothetical protein [Agitococcus sp.]MDO9179119.1 hypothetical protein [Agitococcus sp.]